MMRRCAILAAGLCLAAGTAGWSADNVKRKSGSPVIGEVTRVSREAVEVKRRGSVERIAANEILTVFYQDAPTLMKKTAWDHFVNGRYEDALTALDRVKPGELKRKEIKQELEFYKALCAARLALAGTGTIEKAGKQMFAFKDGNPDSYHYLEACEVVGDLLVARGSYSDAETYYKEVADAPWPDYKMRAHVAIGRAQLAQGKAAQALQSFETVLAMEADSELARAQQLAATLGKARCKAAEQKYDEAVNMVEQVILTADPEDVELHARAYNALGNIRRQAGQTKEALLAYLHVDVLYFSVPDAHAEALANLVELWTEVQEPARASQARKTLQQRYADSPWAKKGDQ